MNKLSVFIIAQNEVDRISRTIESVKGIADEIIVIDSGSTDGTQLTASSLGAKVIYKAWQGYGEQKRFGEEQCTHDWVLNLDADEVLTPKLAQEIQETLLNPLKVAYEMRFQDSFPQEKKMALFTYHRMFIRLYNRKIVRFSQSPVHDSVLATQEQTAQLNEICHHYSYRSIPHHIEKSNGYTSLQAQDFINREDKFSLLRLVFEFPIAFFKVYLFRRFIFRGLDGFIYSMLYAFARFSRIAKWYELRKR